MLGEEDGKESGASISQDFHGQSTTSGGSDPQGLHGQSIASDEINSVGAEGHSGMELKTTEKATQIKLQRIHTRVQRLGGFQRIQMTLYCTF